jgi:nucleoside phosphorylase
VSPSVGRYPNVGAKLGHASVYGPADFFAGAGRAQLEAAPEHVILAPSLLFVSALQAHNSRFRAVSLLPPTAGQLYHDSEHEGVGVACSAGNPATIAVLIENLVHLGSRRIVLISTADAIGDEASPGDVYVITAAVRDDGVSQHYLPAERFATPSQGLTERLVGTTGATAGRAWTLPLRYRATQVEIDEYVREGVAVVDTETAAVFAVASALGVECGACLVGTGDLRRTSADVDWEAVGQSLVGLLDSVPAALVSEVHG